MPDYSKPAVAFVDTAIFRDWLKSKGYTWPPERWQERDARVCQFWRELHGESTEEERMRAGLNAFK